MDGDSYNHGQGAISVRLGLGQSGPGLAPRLDDAHFMGETISDGQGHAEGRLRAESRLQADTKGCRGHFDLVEFNEEQSLCNSFHIGFFAR